MNDGGWAFPRAAKATGENEIDWEGMTLRDYFAGLAMQGLLADPNEDPEAGETVAVFQEKTAAFAYRMADAMLAERDKPPPAAPADS